MLPTFEELYRVICAIIAGNPSLEITESSKFLCPLNCTKQLFYMGD
jgi:hypothetical protein